jgi:hypothetical protein
MFSFHFLFFFKIFALIRDFVWVASSSPLGRNLFRFELSRTLTLFSGTKGCEETDHAHNVDSVLFLKLVMPK